MADNNKRGWHGDPEGHARAARASHARTFGWLPLLLLPLAFFIGWATNDVWDTNTLSSTPTEFGVGGAPGNTMEPCPEQ